MMKFLFAMLVSLSIVSAATLSVTTDTNMGLVGISTNLFESNKVLMAKSLSNYVSQAQLGATNMQLVAFTTNYGNIISNWITINNGLLVTNHGLLIGAASSNYALVIGQNGTNYALQIGGYGSNYTFNMGTNATNYANSVAANATNYANLAAANASNAAMANIQSSNYVTVFLLNTSSQNASNAAIGWASNNMPSIKFDPNFITNLQGKVELISSLNLTNVSVHGNLTASGSSIGWLRLSNQLMVVDGGTGRTNIPIDRVMLGNGTNPITMAQFIASLTVTNATNVSLVGDSGTPGNFKYYGTDSGGSKGFWGLPISGSTQIYTNTVLAAGASNLNFIGFPTTNMGGYLHIGIPTATYDYTALSNNIKSDIALSNFVSQAQLGQTNILLLTYVTNYVNTVSNNVVLTNGVLATNFTLLTGLNNSNFTRLVIGQASNSVLLAITNNSLYTSNGVVLYASNLAIANNSYADLVASYASNSAKAYALVLGGYSSNYIFNMGTNATNYANSMAGIASNSAVAYARNATNALSSIAWSNAALFASTGSVIRASNYLSATKMPSNSVLKTWSITPSYKVMPTLIGIAYDASGYSLPLQGYDLPPGTLCYYSNYNSPIEYLQTPALTDSGWFQVPAGGVDTVEAQGGPDTQNGSAIIVYALAPGSYVYTNLNNLGVNMTNYADYVAANASNSALVVATNFLGQSSNYTFAVSNYAGAAAANASNSAIAKASADLGLTNGLLQTRLTNYVNTISNLISLTNGILATNYANSISNSVTSNYITYVDSFLGGSEVLYFYGRSNISPVIPAIGTTWAQHWIFPTASTNTAFTNTLTVTNLNDYILARVSAVRYRSIASGPQTWELFVYINTVGGRSMSIQGEMYTFDTVTSNLVEICVSAPQALTGTLTKYTLIMNLSTNCFYTNDVLIVGKLKCVAIGGVSPGTFNIATEGDYDPHLSLAIPNTELSARVVSDAVAQIATSNYLPIALFDVRTNDWVRFGGVASDAGGGSINGALQVGDPALGLNKQGPQLTTRAWYGAGILFTNSKNDAIDVRNWEIRTDGYTYGDLHFNQGTASGLAPTVPRMVLSLTGHMGVGTNNPQARVHAFGGNFLAEALSPALRLQPTSYGANYGSYLTSFTNAIGALLLGNDADNYIVGGSTGTGGKLNFMVNNTAQYPNFPNGTVAMTILANGRVGMGTNAPSSKLDVVGDTKINGFINATGPYTTGGYQVNGHMAVGEVYSVLGIGDISAHYGGFIMYANGAAAALINSSGYMGVGTNGPTEKLEVAGTIKSYGLTVNESLFMHGSNMVVSNAMLGFAGDLGSFKLPTNSGPSQPESYSTAVNYEYIGDTWLYYGPGEIVDITLADGYYYWQKGSSTHTMEGLSLGGPAQMTESGYFSVSSSDLRFTGVGGAAADDAVYAATAEVPESYSGDNLVANQSFDSMGVYTLVTAAGYYYLSQGGDDTGFSGNFGSFTGSGYVMTDGTDIQVLGTQYGSVNSSVYVATETVPASYDTGVNYGPFETSYPAGDPTAIGITLPAGYYYWQKGTYDESIYGSFSTMMSSGYFTTDGSEISAVGVSGAVLDGAIYDATHASFVHGAMWITNGTSSIFGSSVAVQVSTGVTNGVAHLVTEEDLNEKLGITQDITLPGGGVLHITNGIIKAFTPP